MTKVFESPDGGETVYIRETDSLNRHLYSQTDRARSKLDQLKEDKLWGEIRRAARTNPTLQKAMEQCIIIYNLSKDNGNSKT